MKRDPRGEGDAVGHLRDRPLQHADGRQEGRHEQADEEQPRLAGGGGGGVGGRKGLGPPRRGRPRRGRAARGPAPAWGRRDAERTEALRAGGAVVGDVVMGAPAAVGRARRPRSRSDDRLQGRRSRLRPSSDQDARAAWGPTVSPDLGGTWTRLLPTGRSSSMSLVRIHNFSVSLDGFGTGEPQSAEAPFGHAGERLHEWLFRTRFWDPSGSAGVDDALAARHSPGSARRSWAPASSVRPAGRTTRRGGAVGCAPAVPHAHVRR